MIESGRGFTISWSPPVDEFGSVMPVDVYQVEWTTAFETSKAQITHTEFEISNLVPLSLVTIMLRAVYNGTYGNEVYIASKCTQLCAYHMNNM